MQLTPGAEHPLTREQKRAWRRVSGRSVASGMVTPLVRRERGPPSAWRADALAKLVEWHRKSAAF